ncbi:TMEM175 family protein [Blastococcus litoris]|uniref:TMEM175 family protein n=1 Tax=Blastococcus litoris TaxID=2171622 RepID=UPI000E30200B|nr:TMEM175 family protein [Blastococcus litoris]
MEGEAPSRDVTRLVNLSDAVVAIAATLLVLPLVDQIDSMPGATVAEMLGAAGQQFAAFVLSFVVVGRFWLIHHSVFNGVREMTGTLFWLNLVWLIGIVFLPYPTELIGVVETDDVWAPVVYIGTLAVTTLAGIAMDAVIARSPELRVPGAAVRDDLVPGLVTAGTMLVALVIALVLPAVGMWSLLLLVISPLVVRLLSRRRRAVA